MQEKLEKLKSEFFDKLSNIKDGLALHELEVKYLGRKGELTEILRGIAGLSVAEKRKMGALANNLKKELKERIMAVKSGFAADGADYDFIDVTLPGEKIEIGHLHPITTITGELENLFSSMGFTILNGPELESDYYCFTALNIPTYHPARDIQDTFYIDGRGAVNDARVNIKKNEGKIEYGREKSGLVMRTHTSPMQIRAMRKYGVPLRCVVTGRVFRAEATDAVHEHTFDQLEGLMVGRDISIANLIAVLKEMLAGIFQQEVKLRVRPAYFPFVEPGLEVDMGCTICRGKGCPSCKYSGWLEMLGAGMVHPRVLEYGGVNPDEFTGFAFGIGITRLAMMKYGIDDIRLFHSGDLRFLKQF